MKISQLKANEKNPRKISDEKSKGLARSMEEFGDLSGVVFNVGTKRLVGGHQRVSKMDDNCKIVRKNLEAPTPSGTVAEGYIQMPNGERYKYREVDWDSKREEAAMLAANKHGGEWDQEKLKINFANLKGMDLSLTGFSVPELKDFGINFTPPKITVPQPTPGAQTTEQIPTANPNANVVTGAPATPEPGPVTEGEKPKDFDSVEEGKSEHMEKKRFVVIVDCKDEAHKEKVRELLRPAVEQAEAKIF